MQECSWPTSPLTIRTLQRQRKELEQLGLPSNIQKRVNQFVKGGITQAITGELVAKNLANIKAVEIARAIRQGRTKKYTQKSGVITAQTARNMVRDRDNHANEQALEKKARVQEQATRKAEKEAEKTRKWLAKLADRHCKQQEKEAKAAARRLAKKEQTAQRLQEQKALARAREARNSRLT